ncbi:MAG: sctE [Parachlamydiales bacterium]|nr:sctE [Parachlamydiales bacterium]
MYGLEKGKKGPGKFMFDLEVELKERPGRSKELLLKAENRIQEIKQALRVGASDKDFDQLGILLHGYTALQKAIKKAAK